MSRPAACRFFSFTVAANLTSQSGIEKIPDCVTPHVYAVDGERQRNARPNRQPGSLDHIHSTVPAQLGERWKAKVGRKLTAPVVAGGRVCVGCRDAHEVVALDATDGTVVWRYGTGGSMDTPPTVYQGMVASVRL